MFETVRHSTNPECRPTKEETGVGSIVEVFLLTLTNVVGKKDKLTPKTIIIYRIFSRLENLKFFLYQTTSLLNHHVHMTASTLNHFQLIKHWQYFFVYLLCFFKWNNLNKTRITLIWVRLLPAAPLLGLRPRPPPLKSSSVRYNYLWRYINNC